MPEPAGAEWHTVQPSETWMETYERLRQDVVSAAESYGFAAADEGGFEHERSQRSQVLDHAITALDAHVRAGRVDAWLPIESAPKDGTEIIVFANAVGEARFVVTGEDDGEWRWANNDPTDHWGYEIHPTHWRPLPPPPTKGDEE